MKKKIVVISLVFILSFAQLEIVFAENKVDKYSYNLKNQQIPQNDILFDLKIRLFMLLGNFPSLSVCIIKNNTVVWYKGYGQAKFLQKPTINTVFAIGSISKSFLGTAMMQLYEQGMFDLDDNVNNYLDFEVFNPKYPDVNVTFRMLLAHQSSLTGIKPTLVDFNIFTRFLRYTDEYPYPLIKRMIHPCGDLYLSTVWKNYPPGSNASYSSLNFMLLEHLLEVISNLKFTEYCEEKIFSPLNMNNSSFYFKDFKKSQLATTYHNFFNIYFRIPNIGIPYAVGGIKCSIEDLSHYAIAHMNGGVYAANRILNEETIDLMHSIQYESTKNSSNKYGLGWVNFKKIAGLKFNGHTGHAPGGTSALYINQSNDYSILFSTNRFIFFSSPILMKAWEGLITYLSIKAMGL